MFHLLTSSVFKLLQSWNVAFICWQEETSHLLTSSLDSVLQPRNMFDISVTFDIFRLPGFVTVYKLVQFLNQLFVL